MSARMISTEAWVLHRGDPDAPPGTRAAFRCEEYAFPDIEDDELLVEPIYGCWEGNMTHAVTRSPVDICLMRREDRVVLGNAGVVRIVRTGRAVTSAREGDLAIMLPIAATDRFGYLTKVIAYDAPNTIGLLAKQTKLREAQLVVVPENPRYSIKQWAAFSARYLTAWANWQVAYGCWRLQMPSHLMAAPDVFAWGGGVGLAEVTLAKFVGARVFMAASSDDRLAMIERAGVVPVDRRAFRDLDFDELRFETDRQYRRQYLANESAFLTAVRGLTDGLGPSIIIDNIGRPVFRASLRALARQGVLTTVGWKCGMDLNMTRATECISRHIHVLTHAFSRAEAIAGTRFASETGWLPTEIGEPYAWDDVHRLACDSERDSVASYFPLFAVNAA